MMRFLAGDALILAVALLSALIGLVFDLLNRVLRPAAAPVLGLRLFAFRVPCINYLIYFLVLQAIHGGFGWSTPLWAGGVLGAGRVGLVVSHGLFAPRVSRAAAAV